MRNTFDGPSEGRMGEPICTVIAHIEANGRVVDVTWCEGRWLVGDDGVPFARLLAWESAGSLDWVSEETRAWFHALPEVVGEERHPSAVRARESRWRALPFSWSTTALSARWSSVCFSPQRFRDSRFATLRIAARSPRSPVGSASWSSLPRPGRPTRDPRRVGRCG